VEVGNLGSNLLDLAMVRCQERLWGNSWGELMGWDV
jgi:hypothetical protein